jgi:3-oxoacyl-[acyl-carrier-protein] synthase II
MRERVVITGVGLVTPLGIGTVALWGALMGGRSAITRLSPGSEEEQGSRASWLVAPVVDFDPGRWLPWREARHLDRSAQFAVVAAEQAWNDAGRPPVAPERAGVVVGTGFGGIASLVEQQRILDTRGPRRVSPFFIPMMMGNSAAAAVSIRLGLTGLSLATIHDALSAADALSQAVVALRRGELDVVLAGGTEASLLPLVLTGLAPLGLVAPGQRHPETAVRPFSRRRQGFVLGEGAAMLVLERASFAARRGAGIYAELAGYGYGTGGGSDERAFHQALVHALADAEAAPGAIDYVNADGCALPTTDVAETQAIKAVFGAHSRALAVSGTKAATGHLWGAAPALEVAIAALALHHQAVPPTLNWEPGDPVCDLDYVPGKARLRPLAWAVSTSRGLGAQSAAFVLRAASQAA